MNTTLTIVDLGGAIALLIWGVHMGPDRDHASFEDLPEPFIAARRRMRGRWWPLDPSFGVARDEISRIPTEPSSKV
jgi:hypothetical protein